MTQIAQVSYEKVKRESKNQGPKKDKFITRSRNNKNRSMWPEHGSQGGRIVLDRVFTHPLCYKSVDWNAVSIWALELAAFAFLRALTADLLNLSSLYSLSIQSFQSAFKHVCDTNTLKHFLFHSQSLLKLQKRVVNTYSFFPFPFTLNTLQYIYHPNL